MARSALDNAFTGSEDLSRVLQGLSAAVRADILEPACIKAASPIRGAMKRMAPKRTGALRASIIVKGISNKIKGTAAALIGPGRGYYKGGKRVGKRGDRRGADKPSNYAHLVEFGHYSGTSSEKFGGFEKGSALKPSKKKTSQRTKQATARSFVRPQPFIRPGFAAGAPAARALLVSEVNKSITKVRNKLIQQGRHAA